MPAGKQAPTCSQGRRPPQSTSEVAEAAGAAVAEDEAVLAAAAQEQRGFVMTTLRIAFNAAFRHDAPPATALITRLRRSSEYGRGIHRWPPSQQAA